MALPRRSLLTFSPVVATAYIIAILLVLYSNFAVALETKVKLKHEKFGIKR
jgi:FlaG/FlaF family flagellin (archaellin)